MGINLITEPDECHVIVLPYDTGCHSRADPLKFDTKSDLLANPREHASSASCDDNLLSLTRSLGHSDRTAQFVKIDRFGKINIKTGTQTTLTFLCTCSAGDSDRL